MTHSGRLLQVPCNCGMMCGPGGSGGIEMSFVLMRAEHDHHTERAYVEFRQPDADGGDAIAALIFSYRTTERLSKIRVKEEVVRKARHLLKKAALATWGASHARSIRRS